MSSVTTSKAKAPRAQLSVHYLLFLLPPFSVLRSPSNQYHSVFYLLNFFCIALIVVVVIIIAVYSSSSSQFIRRHRHHLRPQQWRPISSSHPSTAFRGSFSARGRPCLERMLFRRRQRQECRRGWKWTCAWRWTGKGFFGWSSWIVCLLWPLKREQFRHTWQLLIFKF